MDVQAYQKVKGNAARWWLTGPACTCIRSMTMIMEKLSLPVEPRQIAMQEK